MKHTSRIFAGASAALAVLTIPSLAAPTARHAIDPRAPIAAHPGIDHTRLYYDEPGDGSLWVRGTGYKASFDAASATFYPAFGKTAPRNFAHVLSPDRVSVGGQSITFERAGRIERDGDHVAFDRGAFVETYDLTPASIEQSFVFATLPRGGDLVVHIPVASELAGRVTASGLEFESSFGRVTYSRAVAIDARGQRVDADTKLENGAITLRVDSGFLAGATLPITIDPVVSSVSIPFTLQDDFSADAAWDNSDNVWVVSYEETFSAADTDVYAVTLSASGALLATGVVDFSGNAWDAPRIAELGSAHQCLVVAAVTSGTSHTISGRTVTPNGSSLSMGAPFDIGGPDVGDKLAPDVGGDPHTGAPQGYYCVAWQRQIPGGNTEIGVRLVASDNSLLPVMYLSQAFFDADSAPSVSKSNNADRWLIAFVRDEPGFHGDIYGAHITNSGALADGPFSVSGGDFGFDSQPCASTPLAGSQRSVITFARFQNGHPSDHDIMAALVDGTSVVQTVDVSALENTGLQSVDQINPSVDSDGQHFIIAYSEYIPVALYYDNYFTDLAVSGNALVLAESHENIWEWGLSGLRMNITAQHGAGPSSHRYLAVYDITENSTDHDAVGFLIDSIQGGSTSPFCFGDGTGAACPCANNGSSMHGCANSVHSSGASLAASSGIPSTINDTLVLGASQLPNNATCIFLQGSSTISPVVFGDGLRCAGGTLIRLVVKTASLGLASYPQAGDQAISVRGGVPAGGGTYSYQLWYRDPASFCTSATYNISNGVLVNWAM
jgi:hypothetical protein